jgi:hypothetical protein
MIGDSLTITYNAASKVLLKVNQDNYGAEYFLRESLAIYRLKISHTIPAKLGTNESHLVRLDVETYDANGELVRTESCWTVMKTADAAQNSTTLLYAINSLVGWTTSANMTKVMGRES